MSKNKMLINLFKRKIRAIYNRIAFTVLLLLFQIVFFVLIIYSLIEISELFSIAFSILSLIIAAGIISKDYCTEYKLSWVAVLLLFPRLGGIFYLCYHGRNPNKKLYTIIEKEHRKIICNFEKTCKFLNLELGNVYIRDKRFLGTCKYVKQISGYRPYFGNDTRYFECGERMFEDMCLELRKAQKYVFLEYFIISEGKMWNRLIEILVELAEKGVKIRIMYDDIGCLALLPPDFAEKINNLNENISCVAFNSFMPFISLSMNNRSHRKITVIDGKVAYTGGINISDEYINLVQKYGYWKDTGVKISGCGAASFTLMFLELWHVYMDSDENIEEFINIDYEIDSDEKDGKGIVQPFYSSPLQDEPLAENVYMEIINQSVDYLYIYTPYLAIDNAMLNALCMAAKRGVDVRLVTPGIADKKIIKRLTMSYYYPLTTAGVKIFEYLPGFMHSKCFVSDDRMAIVGTINMDYRSLYLHFECGVFMYKTKALMQLKNDCFQVFNVSEEVKQENIHKRWIDSFFDIILRMIAPML